VIPLRDTIPSRSFPIVNSLLIAVNVLVFFLTLAAGARAGDLVRRLGVVPARFLDDPASMQILTLFSSMFLHGGWFHLLSNMWALYIFGDNVEDRLGSVRYLFFYLLGGVVAGLTHTLLNTQSQVPTIGASGAISAVMAAYLLLYPRARVITLIPLFFLPWFVELPALLFIGFWFISQLFDGFLSIASGVQAFGGVAYWAHVGGFIAGLAFLPLFLRRRPARRTFPDEYYPW